MDLFKPHLISLLFLSSVLASLANIHPLYREFLKNNTRVSEFRLINRRSLTDCPIQDPGISVSVSVSSPLPDEAYVTVTVSGILTPAPTHWIGMISPSDSSVDGCPLSGANYIQTGDTSTLPLLCHYPVKAQYLSNDPNYLSCATQTCSQFLGDTKGDKHKKNPKKDKGLGSFCLLYTCSGSVTFHVINIRTDIEFVLFDGGYAAPCVLARSGPIAFANPSSPLYGHISSTDSTGTAMRLTWVSGDSAPQQVQYGNGQSSQSTVTTFTTDQMCVVPGLPSPAADFGWHNPGYIHSAVMTGLQPSSTYTYSYGSNAVGWSGTTSFNTPPAAGASSTKFIVFGDMGKAPLDASDIHYLQPGSISVMSAINSDIQANGIDSIFHIGDISYATGFLVEWEYFLKLIQPSASSISYMAAIGNHERDYAGSGSVYELSDSGGECGVPYESYFQMPTPAPDAPWYSIEQGPVHFTIISTEHPWTPDSAQYQWIVADLSSVDRTRTPWLVFAGHRPMYSSHISVPPGVDVAFPLVIEPLLLQYKVDLVLFGHVHNYERTCAVYQNQCVAMPSKDQNGVDTYNNNNYAAPVQVIVGMAGFTLDSFELDNSWSLARYSEFGFARVSATTNQLLFQFVNSATMAVRDQFQIIKS